MFLEGILKGLHVSIKWKRGVVTNQWFGQWSGETTGQVLSGGGEIEKNKQLVA